MKYTSKDIFMVKKKPYKSVIRFMPNFNDTINNRRKNQINKIFKCN